MHGLILQVVVVNDPRPNNPYDQLYTVEYLNNMNNSPLVLYINQPADVLKKLALESIKANEVTTFLLFSYFTYFYNLLTDGHTAINVCSCFDFVMHKK